MAREPEYYPLTLSQRVMLVNREYCAGEAVTDLCAMIHFDSEMDPGLLLQAITLGMMRNAASSLRLHRVGDKVMQYLALTTPEPIPVLDYSDREPQALEADIDRWSRTPFPNNGLDTQLYSIRMILEPGGHWGAYFHVSHLAFDPYALMATAADAAAIYAALRDGTAIPRKKGDYLACCRKDQESEASGQLRAQLQAWTDLFETEPLFSSVTGAPPRPGMRVGPAADALRPEAYHVRFLYPAEKVQAVLAYAQGLRVSPQCLYLLAARSYLSRVNGGQEDITICNTIARRATLLQKRSGGTRVLGIPFRMNLPGDLPIDEALREIYSLQGKYYANPDVLFTDICDALYAKFGVTGRDPMDSYHTFALTYNPYGMTLPEGIRAHLTVHSTGAASQPVYLSIMALDDSGDLTFTYDCKKRFVEEDTAARIHDRIVKALNAILTRTAKTVGEL